MEEGPGGPNYGRRASTNPNVEGRTVALGVDDWQAAEFMRTGGWRVVESGRGRERGGAMTAHRGTLHADEYVDDDVVRVMVERELGFTYEQVRSVYRQGRLSATQRELRADIDARMLALARAGGNVALLGRALGFHVNAAGACEALANALARARAEETS